MAFDLKAYLARIGLDNCEPTPEGLAALQSAQLRTIAFENLDPFLGRVPDLDPQALWDKMVGSGRGGYCFELNWLFGQALAAIGFSARRVMARVRSPAMPQGGARSHLAWVVEIDGCEWLADAGFGGPCPPTPLPLGEAAERLVGSAAFRISRNGREEVLERRGSGEWIALYGYDRAEVMPYDIEAANFVCARWEKAPFPHNLMLAIQTGEGRASMLNRAMRLDAGERNESRLIASRRELGEVLEEPFGLAIDEDMLERVWKRLEAQPDPAP